MISMANWTDFCRASRVLWSTGSTDWMSMLVMTRLLAGNSNLLRTFWFSSNPKTDVRIIRAEFYRKEVIFKNLNQTINIYYKKLYNSYGS